MIAGLESPKPIEQTRLEVQMRVDFAGWSPNSSGQQGLRNPGKGSYMGLGENSLLL